jgi:hypothetical protein
MTCCASPRPPTPPTSSPKWMACCAAGRRQNPLTRPERRRHFQPDVRVHGGARGGMRHETPTSLRIQKARTSLILDHPFFGSLLFRLKGRECRSIQTMATDGVSLFYNPDFVETLNAATLAGTLGSRGHAPGPSPSCAPLRARSETVEPGLRLSPSIPCSSTPDSACPRASCSITASGG